MRGLTRRRLREFEVRSQRTSEAHTGTVQVRCTWYRYSTSTRTIRTRTVGTR